MGQAINLQPLHYAAHTNAFLRVFASSIVDLRTNSPIYLYINDFITFPVGREFA